MSIPLIRRTRTGRLARAWLMMPALLAAGCVGPGASGTARDRPAGGSRALLPKVAPDAAFDAAVYAVGQWFRVAEASRSEGAIRSVTEEFEQKGGTGRIRDAALNFPNRMRRTAAVYVSPHPTGTLVQCEVRVERLDTADHRAFRDNLRFNDYPNETPIDREAGVSAEQDQVWTSMPRDSRLERDILDVIRSRVLPEAPPADGAEN